MHNFVGESLKNEYFKKIVCGTNNVGDPGAARIGNRWNPHQNPVSKNICCLASL